MNYTSNDITEEPDAVVPHVRICMGTAQETGRSTMTVARMTKENYKLYAGKEFFYYSTFEEAKEAAKKFMSSRVGLRIEILIEMSPKEADWWAYEYENNQWVPS